MSTNRRSRRSFLVHSVAGLNAAWVAANYPGILAAQSYVRQATQSGQLPRLTVFTAEQAAEIEAMTAQIIPTDETPGAREAHCVYFIDRALSTFL
jgi:gluconate 2-dehydrogenase gamma chain